MKSVRVIVRGKVQGVAYRYWTEQQARVGGLAGFVRNRTDGAVEAVFSGPDEKVDEIVVRCQQGPSLAHVDEVVCEPVDAPASTRFEILPTI